MNDSIKTKKIILTGLFAAIICLTTAYILHIPVGANAGYVHIGDALIYIAAALLPTPYAMIAASIGAGMADFLTGAAVWMIPTMIIKPILVLFISSNCDKIINTKNVIGSLVAGIIGMVLYMVAEGIMFGNFLAAFTFTAIGLVQPIGSFIVFILLGISFDKLGLKDKLEIIKKEKNSR